MKIAFRSHDGLCPYFIYKGYKFYIQDSRESHGNYTYSLYLRHLKEKTEVFVDAETAIDYIKKIKNIRFVYRSSDTHFYTDTLRYYIVTGNRVKIRPTEKPLSGSFDNYADCLTFAKKYVADFIRNNEPMQLRMQI